MVFGRERTVELVSPEEALPGRDEPMPVAPADLIHGRSMTGPFPEGTREIVFGMGCFWGAERIFWGIEGVWVTSVGYAGGHTPNPTYREVCTGRTGHAEVTRVVYDPTAVPLEELLRHFWEQHDPTTPMRQGNDLGTQYRSAIYDADDEQRAVVEASRDRYQALLTGAGHGTITTEIAPGGPYYFAEDEHQQYLAKHPGGYCNHGFCQVAYDRQQPTGA
ncbi:MAG: peptide-methionine (S)-S-oxide reductase MsrA [Acidimicrobiales bacterium]